MQQAASLRLALAELGARTEVGFRSDPDASARIKALAAELEAVNPCPEPTRAAALLRGRWKLLYSNLGLQRETDLARLSFHVLPKTPVAVVELYNEIDPATGLYDNVIGFHFADGTPGTQVMLGEFRVEDERRLDIRFKEALAYGQGAPVRLPVAHEAGGAHLSEIVYLDEGFRLVRGPHGSLYALERLDAQPMRWSRDGPAGP